MFANDVTLWILSPGLSSRPQTTSGDGLKIAAFSMTTTIASGRLQGRTDQHKYSIYRTTNLVHEHKVLGFWLEISLSFSHHHQLANKEALRILDLIRTSLMRVSAVDFAKIQGQFTQPLLEYGSQIVHNGLVIGHKALEGIQRASSRIVLGLTHNPYSSTSEPWLGRRLGWSLSATSSLHTRSFREIFWFLSSLASKVALQKGFQAVTPSIHEIQLLYWYGGIHMEHCLKKWWHQISNPFLRKKLISS